MTRPNRVTVDPGIMFGKPVIKGTRLTVEQILRKSPAGLAPEDISTDHPQLTVGDIRVAQACEPKVGPRSRSR